MEKGGLPTGRILETRVGKVEGSPGELVIQATIKLESDRAPLPRDKLFLIDSVHAKQLAE